jgi:hypothetical protein
VLDASTRELMPIPTRNPFIAAKNVQMLCSTANARLVNAIALRVRRGPSAARPTAATTFGISVLGIDFAQSTQPPICFAIPKTLCLLELDQNAGTEFAAEAEQD